MSMDEQEFIALVKSIDLSKHPLVIAEKNRRELEVWHQRIDEKRRISNCKCRMSNLTQIICSQECNDALHDNRHHLFSEGYKECRPIPQEG